ncbi:zinc dependent phospholipase C family protein [Clostridium sp. BJN0001]|uniref:zinc dependent phospholipase C family protein n=1 Tax=Clostridium sp. BJN0001 TaxID=2930219 RepID=UPI001FCFB52A|nr:zinc dependent phospholipase C family protein [Clostridium sp. BJN0001]
MMTTHRIVAQNILKNANSKKVYLINHNRFIWGAVKPDCVPKYKFKKHYYNESIEMILSKISYVSSLSIEDILYNISVEKFSEELGVICHFLCDFFCAPHYYRWEFKSTAAVKKHMVYEKRLAGVAKRYRPESSIDINIKYHSVRQVVVKLQHMYAGKLDYKNDLKFSYYICDNVINMILDNVYVNENRKVREYAM